MKKKKSAKWNNFQRNLKKNLKKILVLKILRLLIALKHSFKGFKGKKALFKPFDIFLMLAEEKDGDVCVEESCTLHCWDMGVTVGVTWLLGSQFN